MGLYKNENGILTPIAGRGRAEYGASTVRTGTFTNPELNPNSGDATKTITFDTPMPDADYCLDFTMGEAWLANIVVISKTTTGFTVCFLRPFNSAVAANRITFTYTAFKLYTDIEYNQLIEDKVNNTVIAPVENGATASETRNAGTYIMRRGQFYKVTQTIAKDSAITEGVNIESTSVGEELDYFDELNITPLDTGTGAIYFRRKGNVVSVEVSLASPGTFTDSFGGCVLLNDGKVPARFRPQWNVYYAVDGRTSGAWATSTHHIFTLYINPAGGVQLLGNKTNLQNTAYVAGAGTYVI